MTQRLTSSTIWTSGWRTDSAAVSEGAKPAKLSRTGLRRHTSRRLELVSQRAVEPSEADDRAGQAEEGVVEVGAAFPSGAQPAELVQPGQSALDRPTLPAQSGAVRGAAAGNDRGDPAGSQCPAVGEVVVAAVGQQVARSPSGPAAAAVDRWDCLHQGEELGDVVP